jgi:hypothetical protein
MFIALGQDYDEEAPIEEEDRVTIGELVSWVAPTIDVDLSAARGVEEATCVLKAGDWLRINHEQLLTRIYLRKAAKLKVPLLHVIGEGSGILGFDLSSGSGAAATIGGLRAQNTGFGMEFAGVYKTTAIKADRSGLPLESLAAEMPKWATEQAKIIATMKLSDEEKARVAVRIHESGGSSFPLEVATIISKEGIFRADEITLHALFEGKRILFFAAPETNVDKARSWMDMESSINPDYYYHNYYYHSFGFDLRMVINQIYGTAAGRILAKAWGYTKSELEANARIQRLGADRNTTAIRVERRAYPPDPAPLGSETDSRSGTRSRL